MQFKKAFLEMLSGRAVRLPTWRGFWAWDCGTVMVHRADGTTVDIRQLRSAGAIFFCIAQDDWEVCEPEVRDVPPETAEDPA